MNYLSRFVAPDSGFRVSVFILDRKLHSVIEDVEIYMYVELNEKFDQANGGVPQF